MTSTPRVYYYEVQIRAEGGEWVSEDYFTQRRDAMATARLFWHAGRKARIIAWRAHAGRKARTITWRATDVTPRVRHHRADGSSIEARRK